MGEIYYMILITVGTAEEDHGMVGCLYLQVCSWARWNQWYGSIVTLTYSILKHTPAGYVCTFSHFADGETEVQRCATWWYAIYLDCLSLLLHIIAVFKPQQQKGLFFFPPQYRWCVFPERNFAGVWALFSKHGLHSLICFGACSVFFDQSLC